MNSSFEKTYVDKTQRFFLWVLLAHVPVCIAVALACQLPIAPVTVIGLIIFAGPLLCQQLNPGDRITTVACGAGLMCFSGLLIHCARGMVEFHFHVFVTLALLIMFADWLPIVAAAAVIALHHIAFYFLLAAGVFNYQPTLGVVVIQTVFVVLATIPCCVIARRFHGFISAQGVLSETMHVVASQMVTQTRQLDEGARVVAAGTSRQSAAIQETGAALECISSATRLNAENAENAKQLASLTRLAADSGAVEIEAMKTAMADIKSSSSNIAKIIKTIDEIAFQTNILALNAAVEAARAGEAGLGFAIVADEVRNLAQRSAAAARETSQKIDDSLGCSQRGADISVKVTQSFQEIAGKARQVDVLIAKIAASSNEQNRGIAQVKSAIASLDKDTQQNTICAEESASTVQLLNSQAIELAEVVAMLERMVEGKTTENVAETPASEKIEGQVSFKDGFRRRREPVAEDEGFAVEQQYAPGQRLIG